MDENLFSSAFTELSTRNFTVFTELDLKFSPGVNAFIGANATGKTHILKVLYSAAAVTINRESSFPEKLVRVFLPSGGLLGRLVHRKRGRGKATITVKRDRAQLRVSFSTLKRTSPEVTGGREWYGEKMECAYIPVKEMLSNSLGFLSLYEKRSIHFPEVYRDILLSAMVPPLRGPMDATRKSLHGIIRKAFKGAVTMDQSGEFYHRSAEGKIEFSLLAEGHRKLGLLSLLIQNGTLSRGSILFWDEPEANLNPNMMGPVVELLLELQRLGGQVFLATHSYAVLKELDLRMKKRDKVTFFSLFRNKETGDIEARATDDYLDVNPNVIGDAFMDLYDRDVEKALGRKGK